MAPLMYGGNKIRKIFGLPNKIVNKISRRAAAHFGRLFERHVQVEVQKFKRPTVT
jgi:hypothetical protein